MPPKPRQRKRPLVNARGVEEYAGQIISARRIRRWIEERKMPFPIHKDDVGRNWFDLDDIDRYLASQRELLYDGGENAAAS